MLYIRLTVFLLLLSAVSARAAEWCLAPGRIYIEMLSHPTIADDMRRLGVRTIRVAFEDGGRPENLWLYRDVAAQARSRGIETLGLLDSNSAPPGDPATKAYRDAFVSSVMWHIKAVPEVKEWEIWNEPEVFGFTPDPSRYAPLLIQTFERVRAARESGEIPADVRIVCAAVVDTKWISVVFDAPEMRAYRAANAGGVPFDIANIHPYTCCDPWSSRFRQPLNFTQWFQYISTLRGGDGQYLFGDRPFYFTEFGFSTAGFGLESAKTSLLRMGESMRQQARIRKVFWYDYHDDAETYGLRSANNGSTGGPKPVYYAYAAQSTGAGIYRSAANVTPLVRDRLIDAWMAAGAADGAGIPADEMQRSGPGWVQRFYGGMSGGALIALADATPGTAHVVSGDFLAALTAEGAVEGWMGYPVSGVHSYAGSDRQNFAGGFLLRTAAGVSARRYGDGTGDGAVTRADADLCLRVALGMESPDSLVLAALDAHPALSGAGRMGDTAVTAWDATRILSGGL